MPQRPDNAATAPAPMLLSMVGQGSQRDTPSNSASPISNLLPIKSFNDMNRHDFAQFTLP